MKTGKCKTRSTTTMLAGALAITLILGTSAAYAVEVIQDPAGNAIGVTQLQIDGTFYDVEFAFGKGIDVIGAPVQWPSAGNGSESAEIAVDALVALLGAESTPVATVGPAPSFFPYFDVPYQVVGSNARTVRGDGDGSGGWVTGLIGGSVDYSAFALPTMWATFTEVVEVPTDSQSWGQVKSLYR
jgi:hypothetical protein